jgi:ankyrin repeat protein
VVIWLLSQGANPTIKDVQALLKQNQPIFIQNPAQKKNHHEMIQLLRSASLYWQIVNDRMRLFNVKLTNDQKAHLLLYIDQVFTHQKKEIFDQMMYDLQSDLARFFYPWDKDPISRQFFEYPVFFAAKWGSISRLENLYLDYSSDPTFFLQLINQPVGGITPLQVATNANHKDVVDWLVRHGADPHQCVSLDDQLEQAILTNNVTMVNDCLARGANPNQLINAVYKKNDEIIQLLLANGADPNQQETRGWEMSAIAFAKSLNCQFPSLAPLQADNLPASSDKIAKTQLQITSRKNYALEFEKELNRQQEIRLFCNKLINGDKMSDKELKPFTSKEVKLCIFDIIVKFYQDNPDQLAKVLDNALNNETSTIYQFYHLSSTWFSNADDREMLEKMSEMRESLRPERQMMNTQSMVNPISTLTPFYIPPTAIYRANKTNLTFKPAPETKSHVPSETQEIERRNTPTGH